MKKIYSIIIVIVIIIIIIITAYISRINGFAAGWKAAEAAAEEHTAFQAAMFEEFPMIERSWETGKELIGQPIGSAEVARRAAASAAKALPQDVDPEFRVNGRDIYVTSGYRYMRYKDRFEYTFGPITQEEELAIAPLLLLWEEEEVVFFNEEDDGKLVPYFHKNVRDEIEELRDFYKSL